MSPHAHKDQADKNDGSAEKGRQVKGSDGKLHRFDLDDPDLPDWVEDAHFASGGNPYDKPMSERDYEKELTELQIELVKWQQWAINAGERVVMLLEGRDAAGKGGIIEAVSEYTSPRMTRIVALPKPNAHEEGQWYFQRYAAHLPTRGETVLFDRSWYNRAGVEKVMKFTKPEDVELFLKQAPRFEAMLTAEGIRLIKVYVDVGFEMQLKRFHDRRHDPLKTWKISGIDREAIARYGDYTEARDRMLEMTHSDDAPWVVVFANDKRRARLSIIRHMLLLFEYPGKDRKVIGRPDAKIFGTGPEFALKFG